MHFYFFGEIAKGYLLSAAWARPLRGLWLVAGKRALVGVCLCCFEFIFIILLIIDFGDKLFVCFSIVMNYSLRLYIASTTGSVLRL